MFENGSTFLERIAIVQVFDEHVYDRKGNIVSTLTVAATQEASRRRHPVLVQRTQINLRRALTSGLAFVTAVGIAIGAGLALQTSPYDGPTRVVSVSSGDSVWSLAQGVDTSRPLQDVVTDIEQLNDIQGALQVGQEVRIPTR